MNRLLEGKELDLLPLAEYTKQLLKAQDAKTASLVAQEIFEELEEMMPMFYRNHIQDYYAIKSRFLEGENE